MGFKDNNVRPNEAIRRVVKWLLKDSDEDCWLYSVIEWVLTTLGLLLVGYLLLKYLLFNN